LRDNLAPNHETQHANDILDRELGGTIPLNLDLRAKDGVLFEPAALQAAARVERWARAQPEVRAVVGPGALVERLSETLLGSRALPHDRALVEQVLLLTADQTTAALVLKPGGDRGRILVQLPDLGGRAFESFAVRLGEEASSAFAGLEVEPVVAGMSYVAYRGLNRLSGELVASLMAAFLVITLMLALLFKDLRLALLCLIPNAVPLVTCLAAMALLGWDMNPTSAVVFTVALGIAVDDTIHLVARSLEAERAGQAGDSAIAYAMVRTGRALLITSIILGIGFGLNAFSSFRVNRWFGALGALAIASAFVLDLFVLPALLRLFGPKRLRGANGVRGRAGDEDAPA
ncbi:MAG: efflux RND transporter permease subunit, partial [Myxococcota bacterium]